MKKTRILALLSAGIMAVSTAVFAACKKGPDAPEGFDGTAISFYATYVNEYSKDAYEELISTYNSMQGVEDNVWVEMVSNTAAVGNLKAILTSASSRHDVVMVQDDQFKGLAMETGKSGNGVDRTSDLAEGKLTLTSADCPENSNTIAVVVSFKQADTIQATATVTATRLGKNVVKDGLLIVFESSSSGEIAVSNGMITGTFNVGEEYSVTVKDMPGFAALKVTADKNGQLNVKDGSPNTLAFTYDVFTQSLIGDQQNAGEIDDSQVNGADGVVKNVGGNTFFPVTNEAFGDSVFSVSLNKNNTQSNFNGPALIFENNGKPIAARFSMKLNNEKIDFQNEWRGGWGIDPIAQNWDWYGFDTDGSYTKAWNDGKDIVWTLVRQGKMIYFFVAIEGSESTTTKYAGSFDMGDAYTGKAHWAILVADSDRTTDKEYSYHLSDDADEVAAWIKKVPQA